MSFAFFRDCGGRLRVTRGWLEWPHCVPPNPIWSDTSLFLSVSKSQSSQSPLSSELKPPSSSLESCPLRCPMDQRWELAKIIMRRKRRMLLWATWSSRVVLTSWSSITIRSPSLWGTGHDALVNWNRKKPTIQVPPVKLLHWSCLEHIHKQHLCRIDGFGKPCDWKVLRNLKVSCKKSIWTPNLRGWTIFQF